MKWTNPVYTSIMAGRDRERSEPLRNEVDGHRGVFEQEFVQHHRPMAGVVDNDDRAGAESRCCRRRA